MRKAWWALPLVVALCWAAAGPAGRRIVYHKLTGHLPYLRWSALAAESISTHYSYEHPHPSTARSVEPEGHGRYRTPLGSFAIPGATGKPLLTWLLWEIAVREDYQHGEVRIRPGDTVVDGGAHVGVFTRYALGRGAARVVAIEPEPANLACLEANLAAEIAAGRVLVVKAGIWDRRDRLPFRRFGDNSAGGGFVASTSDGANLDMLPLLPLDDIVDELRLDRVDFIKMDIEGAERQALEGARRTVAKFHPRMAICVYHLPDDPQVIPATVRRIRQDYRVDAKHVETALGRVTEKVLFFEPPE